MSLDQKADKYKSSKGKDIFGEDDIQVIPKHTQRPRETSGKTVPPPRAAAAAPTNPAPAQDDSDEDEPKTYEVVDDEPTVGENEAPNAAEEEEEPAELPQVREKQEVKMGFTEKKFAHLPARESQLKEPPLPKSKQLNKKKEKDMYIDVEDKDPVWLKDKGDHYFKRFDYNAALNAYTKAINEDPEFLAGRLNRASCFIKLRGFVACVDDCSDIVKQIERLNKEEYESDRMFYDKIMARALVKRGAAQSWMSSFDEAIADFEKILASDIYCGVLGQLNTDNLRRDLLTIKTRKESQEIKFQGDALFYQEDLDGALAKYLEALEKDPFNEYAIANIGAIYMMKGDHEQSIDYCTQAIEIID